MPCFHPLRAIAGHALRPRAPACQSAPFRPDQAPVHTALHAPAPARPGFHQRQTPRPPQPPVAQNAAKPVWLFQPHRGCAAGFSRCLATNDAQIGGAPTNGPHLRLIAKDRFRALATQQKHPAPLALHSIIYRLGPRPLLTILPFPTLNAQSSPMRRDSKPLHG